MRPPTLADHVAADALYAHAGARSPTSPLVYEKANLFGCFSGVTIFDPSFDASISLACATNPPAKPSTHPKDPAFAELPWRGLWVHLCASPDATTAFAIWIGSFDTVRVPWGPWSFFFGRVTIEVEAEGVRHAECEAIATELLDTLDVPGDRSAVWHSRWDESGRTAVAIDLRFYKKCHEAVMTALLNDLGLALDGPATDYLHWGARMDRGDFQIKVIPRFA